MTAFQIIDAKPFHCGQMVRLLRHEHQRAVLSIGINSHRGLRDCFDRSCVRRSWLIDGRLAAVGGVMGTELSATGFVWLALSETARKYPIAIVKEARRQLDEIMVVKRELATTILNGDDAARRLAIFLGFHVSHDGRGSMARSRFARRDLARYIDASPEHRIPIGSGYVVAMGYHGEAA